MTKFHRTDDLSNRKIFFTILEVEFWDQGLGNMDGNFSLCSHEVSAVCDCHNLLFSDRIMATLMILVLLNHLFKSSSKYSHIPRDRDRIGNKTSAHLEIDDHPLRVAP